MGGRPTGDEKTTQMGMQMPTGNCANFLEMVTGVDVNVGTSGTAFKRLEGTVPPPFITDHRIFLPSVPRPFLDSNVSNSICNIVVLLSTP